MKLFGRREKKTENDFEKLIRENKKLFEQALDFDKELKGDKNNDKH